MNKANRSVVQQLKASSLIFRFLQQHTNKPNFSSSVTPLQQKHVRFFQRQASQVNYFSTKPSSNQQQINEKAAAANTSTQQKLNNRDHPAYGWLKQLDEIKKNVGQFVQLPILPCEGPKEFDDVITKSFLLTNQRAELLERVINAIKVPNELATGKGMVLYGPNGMGKTSFAYLMAAYAWVNRLPLVYIVCCELVCLIIFFCFYFIEM